jgi:hypothetical protein
LLGDRELRIVFLIIDSAAGDDESMVSKNAVLSVDEREGASRPSDVGVSCRSELNRERGEVIVSHRSVDPVCWPSDGRGFTELNLVMNESHSDLGAVRDATLIANDSPAWYTSMAVSTS